MKKVLFVIPIAILSIMLSSNINALAYRLPSKPLLSYNNIFIVGDSWRYILYYTDDEVVSEYLGSNSFVIPNFGSWDATSLDLVYSFIEQNPFRDAESGSYRYYFGNYLQIIKGSISGELPDYTIYPTPPPEPSWWDNLKEAFMDFVGSEAMSAVISGDWLSYLDEVLFGGLWTVPVGEGEDELVEFYTVSATPSPSPSPTPTLIPVQINIDPDTGNVTYNYTVIVSGTPIPTSSPVNPNPPTSGGGDGGSGLTEPIGVEDYYEPDDSLSIPNLRIFQFQLDLPGSTTDIGVDSLDNNFEVMNGYLEDNSEAITTVSSFFQVIPSEWFLLLGAIACFPIIAAMIKSLLGG